MEAVMLRVSRVSLFLAIALAAAEVTAQTPPTVQV